MKSRFKLKIASIILSAATLLLYLNMVNPSPPRVLVFSKTKGWKHTSIPFANAAIQKLGKSGGFLVDTTTDSEKFTDENLKNYQAIIFNCTTGNVLNGEQQAAFERYIQAGGGYAGIHSAADTEYGWAWYNKLMGAHFSSHPHNPNIRKATIDIVDKNHPATSFLPDRWERTDEWYNYRSFYNGLKVLATLDESTFEGGTNGISHPISWYHEFDGGRAFYTGLGHTDESYSEPQFLSHLAGGIKYAIGEGKPLDYAKSFSKVTPDQNRFVKTVLKSNLASPMELVVANDGRVFFTELLGNISVYDTKTGKYALVKKMPITNLGGTGLIGVTVDPNFDTNQFIYFYYAPAGQTEDDLSFQLSRFTISKRNVLDLASEKILLKVPVQKNSGSHHGGSLAWDKDGNLFLSTGDSTSPFPSDGYAPLDERSGKEFYSLDAQRGAANTNDFKGKILRIHPETDGTYTIPQGNLFAKGTDKTRPEIYVMGTRNPYRITVNPKTSVLYWGEIGPDAGKESERGPKGYDEFNQAKKAGNYGWPYFVGNNYAYAEFDFITGKAGSAYDAQAPVNNSPNNTGLTILPSATPAMIWYPYDASEEFPELGIGGRCAIGGSFYEFDKNDSSPSKFPDYYDGTLFVADWMRNWVLALHFDKDENYVRSEPFMPIAGDFRRPIDMAFGKNGVMYILEYGSVYGAANIDARLVKIEYNTGNRPPIAKASIVDTIAMENLDKSVFLTSERKVFPIIRTAAGQAPLTLKFSSLGSTDLDDDEALTYKWFFKGTTLGENTPGKTYTYTRPGSYKAILEVTDKAGLTSSDTLVINVGNTIPGVQITSADNKSFYWKNKPFRYSVKVNDKEDKYIDNKLVKLFYVYNSQPVNPQKIVDGSSETVSSFKGKSIMSLSDCNSCHLLNKTAVGPSFIAIANRYKTQKGSSDKLAKKIINGGGGSWGKTHVMSAHPQIPLTDSREIVKYIFSLTDKKKADSKKAIPLNGSLVLKENMDEPRGQYTLVASYTDKGGKIKKTLTGTDVVNLRSAKVHTVFADTVVGFPRFKDKLSQGGNKAYILLRKVDLTGIKKFNYSYSSNDMTGEIQVRIDSQSGPVISSVSYAATGSWDKYLELVSEISKKVSGKHDVYFIAVKHTKPNDGIIRLTTINFEQ